jgi:hypothetical protein
MNRFGAGSLPLYQFPLLVSVTAPGYAGHHQRDVPAHDLADRVDAAKREPAHQHMTRLSARTSICLLLIQRGLVLRPKRGQ